MYVALEVLRIVDAHPEAKRMAALMDENAADIQKIAVAHGNQSLAAQPVIAHWRNKHLFLEGKRALERVKMLFARLKGLYQEAILCCIRHRVHKWWEFFSDAAFDSSIPMLSVDVPALIMCCDAPGIIRSSSG